MKRNTHWNYHHKRKSLNKMKRNTHWNYHQKRKPLNKMKKKHTLELSPQKRKPTKININIIEKEKGFYRKHIIWKLRVYM